MTNRLKSPVKQDGEVQPPTPVSTTPEYKYECSDCGWQGNTEYCLRCVPASPLIVPACRAHVVGCKLADDHDGLCNPPTAQETMGCTHPDGVTLCNWCGYRAPTAQGEAEVPACDLCEKGFPIEEGEHYGTQSLGMIPTTRCRSLPIEDEKLREIRERVQRVNGEKLDCASTALRDKCVAYIYELRTGKKVAEMSDLYDVARGNLFANAAEDIRHLLTRLQQAEAAQSRWFERYQETLNRVGELAKYEGELREQVAELTAQVESVRRETLEAAAKIAEKYDRAEDRTSRLVTLRAQCATAESIAREIRTHIPEAAAAEGSK